VLLDGVVVGAAALVAEELAPGARAWWLAGHRSVEPAHTLTLEHLGLEPLLDLGMRLGEGSGALTALPLVLMAGRVLAEMATFADAGVSETPAAESGAAESGAAESGAAESGAGEPAASEPAASQPAAAEPAAGESGAALPGAAEPRDRVAPDPTGPAEQVSG
jgi:nicotinate-nucleotide--dimethylbenzimidazole phosphoribosyltransferase